MINQTNLLLVSCNKNAWTILEKNMTKFLVQNTFKDSSNVHMQTGSITPNSCADRVTAHMVIVNQQGIASIPTVPIMREANARSAINEITQGREIKTKCGNELSRLFNISNISIILSIFVIVMNLTFSLFFKKVLAELSLN